MKGADDVEFARARGLAAAFFRSCLYVFAGVVLLVWAVELACRYWWVLVLGAGAGAGAAIWRWCARRW